MKIKTHENTGMIYLTANGSRECFELGKLAEKLRDEECNVVHFPDGTMELQCVAANLVELAVK